MQSQRLKDGLEAIAKKHGDLLKPEDIVAEASAPEHPFHDRFEWDDTKAGHAWRIEQARELIRSVRVEVTVHKRTISTVFYVRDPSLPSNESGYRSLTKIRTSEQMVAATIVEEFARAEAVLTRARDLAAALGLEDSIAEVMAKVRSLAEKVQSIAA